MSDVKELVQMLNLRLTMDRDFNITSLEKQLALVRDENNEQRFRRMGVEWMPGTHGFERAVLAAIACHREHDSPLAMGLSTVTRLEVLCGEELGKPGTVRLDVSQSGCFPSFECYVSINRFMKAWRGGGL